VPGIIGLLRSHYHFALPKALFAITPCFAFFTAFSSAYKGPDIELFWISVALITGLSWFAFIAAATIIRRAWHDRPDTLLLMGWRGPWRSWVEGVRRRASYRQALLSVNPYYWLAARNPLKPYYVFWFLGICGAIWFILWCYNGRQMLEMEAFFTCAALLQTGVKIWFASEAGRQLHEDRKSSALELTLSTPLQVREILEGQFLALLRQFGAPIAVILCFDVTGMIVGARMRFSSDTEWILTWVAMIIIFLVDIMTISALGMWLGLSRKRPGRAIAQTLFSVLGLPWLVLFGMVTYMSLVNFSQMGSANFFIGAYFVVSLVIDFVLFLNASGNLTSRFRQVATQRFDVSR
ncbi:MAG TPA: hypothetical protein VGR78_01975, partial [Verrucomicrobiae bacterium]|nr:hypothetical protein [Verrucomicrobiae bacterium]